MWIYQTTYFTPPHHKIMQFRINPHQPPEEEESSSMSLDIGIQKLWCVLVGIKYNADSARMYDCF